MLIGLLVCDTGWAYSKLSVSLEQDESYDDNVFLTATQVEDDFIHLTGLDTSYKVSNFLFSSTVYYYLGAEFYSKNDELNNVEHAFDLKTEITPYPSLFIRIQDQFRFTDKIEFTGQNLELRPISSIVRTKRKVNNFGLIMDKQLTDRTVVSLNVTHLFYDVNIIEEVDEDIGKAGIGFQYGFGRKNRHHLSIELAKTNFTFQENTLSETSRDFSTYTLINKVELNVSPSLLVIPSLGSVKTLDSNRDSLTKDDYFIIGGISCSLIEKWMKGSLYYDHQVSGRGGFGELVLKDVFGIHANSNIKSRTSIIFSGYWTKNSYSDANVSRKNKDSDIIFVSTGVEYKVKPNIAISGSYSFYSADYEQPLDVGIYDYNQSSAELALEYNFFKKATLKLGYEYTWRRTGDSSPEAFDFSFERNQFSLSFKIKEFGF